MRSYVDRMRSFRNPVSSRRITRHRSKPSSGASSRALSEARSTRGSRTDPAKNKGFRNPLSVRKGYPRKASLQRRLTRYYEACTVSKTAKRFSGRRKKQYCAGVAWKRVKLSGRYKDYFSRESGMKSRARSRVAKARKRDRKGHFVKSAAAAPRRRRRRYARETAAAPRRKRARRVARAAAPRRRRRRSAARDWPGQPRRHRKAALKGWRRRKAKAAARRRSRRHVSEPNPIKRRRRRRRSAARDWSGQPRRHRKAALKGWRRRNRKARRSSPRTRTRDRSKPRRTRARKSAPRRWTRSRQRAYSRKHHYGPAQQKKYEYEASDYVLANPLSGGELVLVGITGALGYGISDFIGRYMATAPVSGAANSIPSGQTVPNDVAVTAMPGWKSMASQAGVAAVPLIASAFLDNPWARASFQGFGLGAGFALVGWLMRSALSNLLASSPLGQQCYLAEIEANAALNAAGGSTSSGTGTSTTTPATTPSATSAGTSGLPRGVGRPPFVRPPQVNAGLGAVISPPASAGPPCAPCSTTSVQDGYQAAFEAARTGVAAPPTKGQSLLAGLHASNIFQE